MIQAYLDLLRHQWQFTKDYGWKIGLITIGIATIIFIIMWRCK